MSVTPLAFKVAAVAKMMNSAMRFEIPMPTMVSVRMRASSGPASRGVMHSALTWRRRNSSTSCPACQKNR